MSAQRESSENTPLEFMFSAQANARPSMLSPSMEDCSENSRLKDVQKNSTPGGKQANRGFFQ